MMGAFIELSSLTLSDKLFSLPEILRTTNAALEQMIAHRFTRAEQTVLDRAQRKARYFRNFVVAQILRMSQHDQFTITSRQQLHHGFDFRSFFFSFTFLLRRQPAALDRNLAALAVNSYSQRLLAHRVTAQVIDCSVMRNLVDPG